MNDDAPLDATDAAILRHVAAVHAALDPPPSDLDERVLFAIAVDGIDGEIARLARAELAGSGARDTDRIRTITFDGSNRTVMVTLVRRPDGLLRLDGWLAPPEAARVELRLGNAETVSAEADAAGRFVFDAVPTGMAQLVVHAAGGGSRLVTPSLVL